MATILQENLAREIVKDIKTGRRRNKKQLLVSSGYSEATADASQHVIFAQKGVQEKLKELGFSMEGADLVVTEILQTGKQENRLRAADMIYKRLGSYKDTGAGGNKTLVLIVTGETANRYALKPDQSTG